MTQTSNRLLDEFAKLMTDAAGVAQGMRREVETAVRSQAERFLGELDVVQREEFEAVRDMAARAREENEALKKRLDALEAKAVRRVGGAGQATARAMRWAARPWKRARSDTAPTIPWKKPRGSAARLPRRPCSSIVGAEERFGNCHETVARERRPHDEAGPSCRPA